MVNLLEYIQKMCKIYGVDPKDYYYDKEMTKKENPKDYMERQLNRSLELLSFEEGNELFNSKREFLMFKAIDDIILNNKNSTIVFYAQMRHTSFINENEYKTTGFFLKEKYQNDYICINYIARGGYYECRKDETSQRVILNQIEKMDMCKYKDKELNTPSGHLIWNAGDVRNCIFYTQDKNMDFIYCTEKSKQSHSFFN